ncbi:DNA polymerase III subunit alpha, partial [Candidatus Wolfebacteria bacterium CG10_big_fil_rev_8_21_14_0_10_31_9]
MKFIHLHTHSHYSLLDGLAKIGDLINRAKELNMDSLALTDHGNLYGALEFYKKARKAGIKPILGMEAYVSLGSRFEKQLKKDISFNKITDGKERTTKENYHHLTLLVENETGWKNLIKIATLASLEGFYYKPRADKELLKENHNGLIALSGCLGGEIPQLIINDKISEAENVAKEYLEIFGLNNFFLEIWNLPHIKEAGKAVKGIIELGKKLNIPLVATQDIHYARKEDAEFQDILVAVQTGNKINDEGRLTMRDGNFSMRSGEEMAEFFKENPEAIDNTVKIAERCNVELELGRVLLPKFALPEEETSDSYLEKLVQERVHRRYSEINDVVKDRMDYEMRVIKKTGYADYFLIVQDFVIWAKNHGIVVGPGRGSAAGSLVSYVLGITDIDPIKYELLFERFLNPDRIQMPDIDIDFTDARRDEVFSYIREKYGEDSVAQIITFGTMAARAAIRDAGRALGMPYSLCDQISKLIPLNPTQGMKEGWLEESLVNVAELKEIYEKNSDAKKIIDVAKKLEGVVRHASVHACGVVIAPEPLINYLPLQRAPQNENIIISQFEMHAIEDIGLLKIDLLGLKNLTIIEETLRLIKDMTGETVKISEIPLDDEKTFKLLKSGDTTGVFQLESGGIRRYLKELKPTELEDIIAMVALYRPGPIELIPQYIRRKFGKEDVVYIHPKLEPILKQTHGIGVYQEQMMRIARDLAGFTLAEADTLRKAIGKKIKELLNSQREKLISGMIKNGIDEKTAKEIWELFPPFARYGFNRSHAACYAMIAYQTAYLKAQYPIEFATALFNADSSDTERISFLIGEVKKMGIKILAPDINNSFASFTPEGEILSGEFSTLKGAGIRFGLLAIKNVGDNVVEAIIEERQKGGCFEGMENFLKRVTHKDLNKKSLESMIKAGVFDSFEIERGKLLGNIDEILKYSQNLKKNGNGNGNNQTNLFGDGFHSNGHLRLTEATPASKKEKLQWEKELLGLYVSDHPLNDYALKLAANNVSTIKELLEIKEGQGGDSNFRIAGIITNIKKILTKSGRPMLFAKIEDLNDGMEVVVFTDTLSKNPDLWENNNVIIAEGRLSRTNDELKLVC